MRPRNFFRNKEGASRRNGRLLDGLAEADLEDIKRRTLAFLAFGLPRRRALGHALTRGTELEKKVRPGRKGNGLVRGHSQPLFEAEVALDHGAVGTPERAL